MPDDDKAHFPNKYNENYLYLLEVDPTHIHAFWEVVPDSIPDQVIKKYLNRPDLCLKIYCNFRNNQNFRVDLNVQGLINDWFIGLERPLVRCYAELGYNDPGEGRFFSICRSNNLDIVLEQKVSEYSIKEENLGKTTSNVYQEKRDEANPFLDDPKKEKKPDPMELITEKDIRDYYNLLSERRVFDPGFSPWRLILERINSAEALRVLRPSEHINLYEQNLPSSETYSSYWSAISSYSNISDTDKVK